MNDLTIGILIGIIAAAIISAFAVATFRVIHDRFEKYVTRLAREAGMNIVANEMERKLASSKTDVHQTIAKYLAKETVKPQNITVGTEQPENRQSDARPFLDNIEKLKEAKAKLEANPHDESAAPELQSMSPMERFKVIDSRLLDLEHVDLNSPPTDNE